MRKDRIRALRDLAIAAVLIFLSWIAVGAPLPLASMKMHREERQDLVERSEIVWRYDDQRFLGLDLGTGYHGPDILVGLAPTAVHVYSSYLDVWPRDPEGPTLVVLPTVLPCADGGSTERSPVLLAADPPAGAQSARLTLALKGRPWLETDFEEAYQMEGVRDGAFFRFQLPHHYLDPNDPMDAPENLTFRQLTADAPDSGRLTVPYTLEFFDGDGALISSSTNSS